MLFYHPLIPSVPIRFDRDEEYIKGLSKAVKAFVLRLDACKDQLAHHKSARERQVVAAAEAESPF